MTVQQIIEARSPSTAIDSRVLTLITLATVQISTVYGDYRNEAIAYMVLHWLTLEGHGGAAGSIKSEKEGDLSRSYGANTKFNDLTSTSWGLEVIRLRNATMILPMNRQVSALGGIPY